ncbi:putative F-box protein At1g67623 [Vicia villosa]|uniref:putative F-box protein At1g67623 n=1 Tax=Vicia villosa TaxID=3911 RepID=UPI00273AA810|nr:putative F-box protein At1g67623 [Vicia villosa]
MSSSEIKLEKKSNKSEDVSSSSIQSLPRDLLRDVIINVGSQSFVDLHKIKVCCKDFLEVAQESENIESLYREGLLKYFNYSNGNIDGLESLKIAAQKGHKEAIYVYGMILLCSEDHDSRKMGIEHMRFLRKSKCIMSSRRNVQNFIDSLWKNDGMLVRNQTPICNSQGMCHGWRVKDGRWSLLDDEDDDTKLCENCRWDYELDFFYKLLNVH